MNIHEIVVKIMNIHDFVGSGWGILHPSSMNIVKSQHIYMLNFGQNFINILMNIHEFVVTIMNIHELVGSGWGILHPLSMNIVKSLHIYM